MRIDFREEKEEFDYKTRVTTYRVLKNYHVEAKTKEECFKEIYPYERTLRYCNGYYIRINDSELEKEYLEWKKTGVDIMMYYGGGVVD